MSRKIAILADLSNLYLTLSKKYSGRKLDYQKYYDYVRGFGEVTTAIAYGAQLDNEAESFIKAIENIGWLAKYKLVKTYPSEDGIKLHRKADCPGDFNRPHQRGLAKNR